MKKYIPLDFDEKGKAVLGKAKDAPTPNGTIPAIFIPGGSDEEKQGLKSISISPAIQTTPALDSLFPVYYDDLPEGPGAQGGVKGFTASLTGTFDASTTYTATVTPTSEWYATHGNATGEKGEPVTLEGSVEEGMLVFDGAVGNEPSYPPEKVIVLSVEISA